jgi:argininosuccinate lyase
MGAKRAGEEGRELTMWGGRFNEGPDAGFMEFSASIGFDIRLFPYDIECTRAWSGVLGKAGIIAPAEVASIENGLDVIAGEFDAGEFTLQPSDEHTAVERRLIELVGRQAGMVRTGRSRNDQVATDLRLFAMAQCERLTGAVRLLQTCLVDKAEECSGIAVPGHTHLQQAQPVLLAHVILAFANMLERDIRLLEHARQAADCMPLGSGALAGTTVSVDRQELATSLGFTEISSNSMDAVGDRDFACDLLYACVMVMIHLSRLAEQVVLWASSEWALAELHDSWATGSSLMPQKKNPDAAELVRGKAGRVAGDLMGLLMVIKGLPLSYNRDLQEDKEGLFDAVDTAAGSLMVMQGTISTITFDPGRASELAGGGYMTATDLADYLASRGLDFPEAHRLVGEVVAYCAGEGKGLQELTVEELARFSDLLGGEAIESITVASSMERRSCTGGTASAEVATQIARLRETISQS